MRATEELVDQIQSYLLLQDRKVVARHCAYLMIELHQLCYIDELIEDEKISLLIKIRLKLEELRETKK